MRLIVAALVLTSPLAAQNCTFAVSPLTFNVPSAASTANTITVSVTPANCNNQGWVANPTVNWIHITSATLNGSGTAVFSVDANPLGVVRTASIAVANQQVTVSQAAAACKFGLTPTSQNLPVSGGSGAVLITANCAWAISTDAGQWIKLPPNLGGGTTDTTVTFSIAGNGCISGRGGNIYVSGSGLATALVSAVTQDGSPSNFTLSATSAAVPAASSNGFFTVNTGVGCGWSTSSNVSWLHIIGGFSGLGGGNVGYQVDANSSDARTGLITVNAAPGVQMTYTVTQQAAGPPPPSLTSVNNAASYASDAVSPGEIVTLFGQNLGPKPLVPLKVSNGALTTNLGGTQVLFDGVPAPMIYSFQTQVSAIAPYGLAGKTSTQVQVQYNGVPSNVVTMPVQPSTPAIFSLDSTGLGPGAILNQDSSINSTALPAARGTVVAIYCTGGGATSPAVADGAVVSGTPPLPQLVAQPVTVVTIGGVNALVTYAGAVPGSVAGLTQINVEVPQGVAPGNGIPVVVKIGSASSTAAVTMSVK